MIEIKARFQIPDQTVLHTSKKDQQGGRCYYWLLFPVSTTINDTLPVSSSLRTDNMLTILVCPLGTSRFNNITIYIHLHFAQLQFATEDSIIFLKLLQLQMANLGQHN